MTRPRYRRQGHLDPVNGKFTPFTAEELADAAADRRTKQLWIVAMALVMVFGAVAYWLGTLVGSGVLG